MKIVAAIPAFNSSSTLARVIAALARQSPAPAEVLIVDDGSADATIARSTESGARVVALGENLGRGAARARIMAESDTALVLMCDATLEAAPDFLTRSLPYFVEPRVAAVFGHITQPPAVSVAERWRKRHLFKTEPCPTTRTDALLATGVCILRADAVREVGGFNAALRSGEDADLGRRLLAAGWHVIADPALHALCIRPDSATEVLTRYARWNSPAGLGCRAFFRQLSYAVKVMMPADLRARDPLAALFSVASPFFQIRSR